MEQGDDMLLDRGERGDMSVQDTGQREGGARDVLEDGEDTFGGGACGRLGARGGVEAGERLAALLERGAQAILSQGQDAQGQAEQPGPAGDAALVREVDGTNAQVARLETGEAALLDDLMAVGVAQRGGGVLVRRRVGDVDMPAQAVDQGLPRGHVHGDGADRPARGAIAARLRGQVDAHDAAEARRRQEGGHGLLQGGAGTIDAPPTAGRALQEREGLRRARQGRLPRAAQSRLHLGRAHHQHALGPGGVSVLLVPLPGVDHRQRHDLSHALIDRAQVLPARGVGQGRPQPSPRSRPRRWLPPDGRRTGRRSF